MNNIRSNDEDVMVEHEGKKHKVRMVSRMPLDVYTISISKPKSMEKID